VTPERRRRGRISAQKGAIAFSGSQHGPIIDASLEGLCFQYVTNKNKTAFRNVQEEMGKGTLDIVFGAYDFTLNGLPVKTVADFQVSNLSTEKPKRIVRRRSIAFGKLSSEQFFNLKRFLLLSQYGEISR
jgi:hypothetical protein